MPSDIVSVAVSTGLGVSVLAGIVSGVCYVLANRMRAKRRRKPGREWYCDVCGTYLRSIHGILEGDKVVTCSKCRRRVCRGRCSALSEESGWMCRNCLDDSDSWIRGILNVLPFGTTADEDYRMNLDPPEEPKRVLKEQVRDFIEKLVASMLGENVDDASVSKMYNEEQYLPSSGQSSPSAAHVLLKNLIERLLQECANLPELRRIRDHPAHPDDQTDRTYEDLLATAIINKVISSTQNRPPSSSTASVSSKTSRNREKEYFFGEETLDSKWKTNDADTTSVSSLEDWLYSDSSIGSRKVVDKETFTIKQLIEEVSQSEDSEDEVVDDREYLKSKLSIYDDDEPNWFLQKRQFRGTNSPVPVPMLVPKPTTEAKVLIGDKEVDETSDLSDVASDFGDVDDDDGPQPTTRQALLVESKRLIGGKNPSAFQGGSDGESSADSGVKELRDKCGYDEPIEEEQKRTPEVGEFVVRADITVDDDNVEDASILSVYSNTEKVAEYTEKYASLPRTVTKSPTPPIRQSLHKSAKPPEKLPMIRNETTDEDDDAPDGIFKFSGSYSKREKEKWKHAIEMKNNPYSKENIEKRIKRSRSAASSIFGPDYYARLASTPSGGKLRPQEARDVTTNGNDEDEVFENNVTSDSDVSYVNFYDVEHSQVYKKTKEELAEENPEYDEKPRYIKSTSVAPAARTTPGHLRRHRSESDLLEDSFDAPPKVLGRKKDNTLISKIYSQPHVRNFALNSRKQVPQTPTLNAHYSFSDTEHYNGKSALYGSDDGNSPKSINIDEPTRRQPRNHSISSEDDVLSETSKISSRHLIYSSSEDLLSIEEHERPHQKKDNTLIEKIYRNANVRNFAMSNRDYIPIREPRRKLQDPENEPINPKPAPEEGKPEIVITPYEEKKEVSVADQREQEVVSPDPEIDEIAKRKIVHQVLEQIAEKPKVATRTKIHQEKAEINNNNHNFEDKEITISVKELRKMFETNETKNLVHSSLTGRSLSKQLKETLKN